MTNTSFILCAIAATITTSLAHTKSAAQIYCIAVQSEANALTIPYSNGIFTLTPCTVATKARTQQGNRFTEYGYLKTTPAGQRCQKTDICPRIAVVPE